MNIEEKLRERFRQEEKRLGGINLSKFSKLNELSYYKMWRWLNKKGHLTALEAEKLEKILAEI